MATALADQYAAAVDPVFIQKITMSMEAAAVAISSEGTSTPDHANRVALAKAIFPQPHLYSVYFAWACAAQGVDAASNDTAINNSVASVWNAIAGVV